MKRILAVLSLVAVVVIIAAPLASGQDPIQVMKGLLAEQQAQATAQALQAQKVARAREILQTREAASGREVFAPAFTAYWVDRLSKLPLEQLEAIAALGGDSNLAEAVVNAETGGSPNMPVTPAAGLGDSGANLVFTKVTPCRIVDTRVVSAPVANGGTANYWVAGTTGFAAQGGAASGCGVPVGATGVALNVTVTATAGGGWLRAWPYGAAPATASIINYDASTSALANGLMLPICDPATASCTYDLTVRADSSGTHVILDVMGYFMKPSALGTLKTFTTESWAGSPVYLTLGACTNYSSVIVVAPGPGEILVTAKVGLTVNHTSGTSQATYVLTTSSSTCSGLSGANTAFVAVNPQMAAGLYFHWDLVTLRYPVLSAGTYTFYLNGYMNSGTSNSIVFNSGAMKATFSPQ